MALTGFLFTLHTFLLVTLHRDIYGRADYQKWVIQTARAYSPKINPFGPLRNVSRLLFVMLCCSFLASISQLTVGLIKSPWAVIVCLSLAIIAIGLFLTTLWVVRMVISDWLNFIEESAEDSNKTIEPGKRS